MKRLDNYHRHNPQPQLQEKENESVWECLLQNEMVALITDFQARTQSLKKKAHTFGRECKYYKKGLCMWLCVCVCARTHTHTHIYNKFLI